MAIFEYKALSETGKKTSGVIDADSYTFAKERLKEQKLLVTKLSKLSTHPKEVSLKAPLLLSFTRELSELLNAGLPLYDSLLTVEEKYRRHPSHSLFLNLCDLLKSGNQLSFALKAYPKTFDRIYISMVQAAEKTGSLPWVFKELHELIERKQKLKKQLLSAVAYPLFLGGFCFVVVMSLMLFVIPSMRELFEGRSLHPLTQMVLSLSSWVQASFFYLLFLTAICVLSLIYLFKQEKTKAAVHGILEKIPIIKTVLMQAACIRFCRSSSLLLQGGIPLASALSTARLIIRHQRLEKAIASAEKKLLEGQPLSSQLKKDPYIPPLMGRMLSLAEETGRLGPMLHSLSDIYDQELERSLTSVTTFLQPALLILLGAIVGLVILSILLPLTDVSSLISE